VEDNRAAVSPVEDNPVVSRVVGSDSPVAGDPVALVVVLPVVAGILVISKICIAVAGV
jgi:hypothetical protein